MCILTSVLWLFLFVTNKQEQSPTESAYTQTLQPRTKLIWTKKCWNNLDQTWMQVILHLKSFIYIYKHFTSQNKRLLNSNKTCNFNMRKTAVAVKRQQNMCSGTELSHPQIFNANIQTFRMRCGIPEPTDKAVVIKRQFPQLCAHSVRSSHYSQY